MFESREAWLKWRKGGLGASDMPIILGLSPWKTVLELYEDKISDEINETSNFATDIGNEAEPKIRSLFEFKTGNSFPQAVCSKGIFLASLDGRSEDKKEIVEIKCAGRETYEMARDGKVDPKYLAQIQHQLYVCEADLAHYLVYPMAEYRKTRTVSLEYLAHVEVRHDLEFQKKIIDAGNEFWQRVVNRNPPQSIDKDYMPLIGISDLAERWKKLNMESIRIEKEIEEIRKGILEAAEKTGKKRLLCAGIKLTQQSRQGNVDYKRIPELKNVSLDQYRGKSSTFWKMERIEK